MFHFGPATADFGPSPARPAPALGIMGKKVLHETGGVTRPPPPTVITEDAEGTTADALRRALRP